jgi:hypothetical protein
VATVQISACLEDRRQRSWKKKKKTLTKPRKDHLLSLLAEVKPITGLCICTAKVSPAFTTQPATIRAPARGAATYPPLLKAGARWARGTGLSRRAVSREALIVATLGKEWRTASSECWSCPHDLNTPLFSDYAAKYRFVKAVATSERSTEKASRTRADTNPLERRGRPTTTKIERK